ncbi:MAG: hypothetical protein VR75_05020 [Hyphomonadaceae bacterium BRH_c29]|nr:MAG: hypothetical protein VR75_05020 [Hyphomonadaceae bacterium BRH_c29]
MESEAVRLYAGRLFRLLRPDDCLRARFGSGQMRLEKGLPFVEFLWPPGAIAKAACSALPLASKDTMFPSVAV